MSSAAMVVKQMVKDKGRAATLTLKNTGTYDVATSTYTTGVPTVYDVKVYTSEFKADEINGDSIVYGDQKTLIPNVDINNVLLGDIKLDDTLLINGITSRISSIQVIYEGGAIAAYICGARR